MRYLLKIGSILAALLFLSFLQQQHKDPLYYNKQGKPSSKGIETYISNNHDNLIAEYEYRVDTLYDVYLFTENLDEEGDGDLGNFYLPDYIIINSAERYVEYEYKNLTKYQQRVMPHTAKTVKGVLFHEMTHVYFNQILIIAKQEGLPVSPEYGTIRLFPNPGSRFGADFIEEGVCEYVVYYLNESSPIDEISIPNTVEELTNKENRVKFVYWYSSYFLKEFLDEKGLKEGIKILVTNKPPSYDEILDPQKFFSRLK